MPVEVVVYSYSSVWTGFSTNTCRKWAKKKWNTFFLEGKIYVMVKIILEKLKSYITNKETNFSL